MTEAGTSCGDAACVGFDDELGDGKADAGAVGEVLVDAMEAFEDAG